MALSFSEQQLYKSWWVWTQQPLRAADWQQSGWDLSASTAVGGVERERKRGAGWESATRGMCDLCSFSFKGLLLALLKVVDPVVKSLWKWREGERENWQEEGKDTEMKARLEIYSDQVPRVIHPLNTVLSSKLPILLEWTEVLGSTSKSW